MNNIATENPGVLYISSSQLNDEQVDSIMQRVFKKAKNILGGNYHIDTRYTLNIVKFQEKPIYTYVFIEDKRIINIIQGLNPGGTKRIKKEVDATCNYMKFRPEVNAKNKDNALAKIYEKYFGNYYKASKIDEKSLYFGGYYGGIGKKHLWSDLQEEEDTIIDSYKEKHKFIKLDPLWEKYTDPVFKGVEVLPATCKMVDPSYSSVMLEARNVESWVTNDMLFSIFSRYDTKKQYKLREGDGKGDVSKLYYPLISRKDNSVFVSFEPNSNDAKYAIHMQRKTIVEHSGKRQELVFNFHKY